MIEVADAQNFVAGLDPKSISCVVTSPPYFWQRDYGIDGQIGHEPTPANFVSSVCDVFDAVQAALRDDGVVWLNLGDSYYSGNGQPRGSDPRSPSRNWMREKKRALDLPGLGWPKKSLLGIPWMVAMGMQARGWVLRSDVIWCRETAFPEPSVKDRPHRQHEYLFLFSKSRRYRFDRSALPEESVWHIPHKRGERGHSAPFPKQLAERCIRAGSRAGDVVFDPFLGSGTTLLAAAELGRKGIGCDINPEFVALAKSKVAAAPSLFEDNKWKV